MQSQFHPAAWKSGLSQAFTENTDEYIIFTDYTQDISWSNYIFSQTHFTIEQYNVFGRAYTQVIKFSGNNNWGLGNFLAPAVDFNWKILDHFSNHWPKLSKILINLKTIAPCWRLQYGVFLWIRTRSQNLMLPQEEIRGEPVFFCWLYSAKMKSLCNCFTLREM